MPFQVSDRLAETCREAPERAAWLDRLPHVVEEPARRWSLQLGQPFEGDASCAWVAPATRGDGTSVVLKLGMPHLEGEHEIAGLRFWAGDPTVRLLDADDELNAMLLERCEPGTSLRSLPEAEQDVVIAGLLRWLWRAPSAPHPFRPLAAMTRDWSEETMADPKGLVRRFADLLGVDEERVWLWMFARLAAEPRDDWDGGRLGLARALAP